MSLAIALPQSEVPQASPAELPEERFGKTSAGLLRRRAENSLRNARLLFESWLRGCLRPATGGASAPSSMSLPRANIELSLEESRLPGASSSEFRRLHGELCARLESLGGVVGKIRGEDRAALAFWNEVLEAALEILSLFTALEAERAALLAAVDELTGLGGRRALDECLQQERARMRREGHRCTLALLDIDYFKRINDTHGHLAGDRVLACFATLLKSNLRSYDGVYRYGGEEFVLCLPGVDAGQAKRMVDRIRKAAAHTPFATAAGSPLLVSFSAGIAELRTETSPLQSLSLADRALYCAKSDGRNRVYVAPAIGAA